MLLRAMLAAICLAGSWSALFAQSGFDSLNVRFVGNWPFGLCQAVAVDSARNVAFVGSGGGVYVLDVSTPASPSQISENLHTRGRVQGMVYDESALGFEALVVANEIGVEVWDVAGTSTPVQRASFTTSGRAQDVAITDTLVFVADGRLGLRILSVATLSAPYEVGSYALADEAVHLAVDRGIAYVADSRGGLRMIKVGDPASPNELDTFATPTRATAVAVRDTLAFVTDADSGLYVLSTASGAFVELGRLPNPHTFYDMLGVEVVNERAYVIVGYGGLYIVEMGRPWWRP